MRHVIALRALGRSNVMTAVASRRSKRTTPGVRAHCAASMPSSRRISAECSPSSGGARRTRERRVAHLERKAERVHASGDGVLDVFDHVTRMRVRIGEDMSKVVNRSGRNAGGEHAVDPLRRRARGQRAFDLVRRAPAGSPFARRSSRSADRRERVATERRAEMPPLRLRERRQRDVSVARAKCLIRRAQSVRRAHRARCVSPWPSIPSSPRRTSRAPTRTAMCRCAVRGLSCSRAMSAASTPFAANEPDGDVGDRHAALHRRSVRLAGHAHDAAHALRDEVEAGTVGIRTRLPESGNARVDESRVDRRPSSRSRRRVAS